VKIIKISKNIEGHKKRKHILMNVLP